MSVNMDEHKKRPSIMAGRRKTVNQRDEAKTIVLDVDMLSALAACVILINLDEQTLKFRDSLFTAFQCLAVRRDLFCCSCHICNRHPCSALRNTARRSRHSSPRPAPEIHPCSNVLHNHHCGSHQMASGAQFAFSHLFNNG